MYLKCVYLSSVLHNMLILSRMMDHKKLIEEMTNNSLMSVEGRMTQLTSLCLCHCKQDPIFVFPDLQLRDLVPHVHHGHQ
jgi:hypothetical protein